MHYRPILITFFGLLLIATLITPLPSEAQTQQSDGRPDEVVLTVDSGSQLQSVGADYLSPVTQAAHAFTHVLLRWDADIPDGAEVTLAIRASVDGTNWTNWQDVIENHDLWQPSDGPNVEWSQTIAVGASASYWQVRGNYTAAADGSLPELKGVKVSTVDTDAFAPSTAPVATQSISKPSVVSRTAWGSPDGQGSRVAINYYPVNHMVVHHTADSNTLGGSEENWAARVRAEWSFHTYTRGWGDVGYNYLIDPNGVIYEGRAGGDNAVAFHDRANYGSMGVVLIGTYSTVSPKDAAVTSLVNLLAWKADQRDIDPTGSSFYYGCSIAKDCYSKNAGSIVKNIAGHRDVIPGQTTCPGDAAWNLLPSIRSRVLAALGGEESITPTQGTAELQSVSFDQTTIAAGELLRVTFVIKNTGSVTLSGQAPRVDLLSDGSLDPGNDGYVYDQGECFLGNTSGSYPSYEKETNRTRLTLGISNWDTTYSSSCIGTTGGYPWRWGLNSDLEPGKTATVVGYVRFRVAGTYQLQSNAIQEYINYFYSSPYSTKTITVTNETGAPRVAEYDSGLESQARVYTLGDIPDNFLARTANPLSIPRGDYLGSFGWTGTLIDWGSGGPKGATDGFMIEQTRSFNVATAGTYTFRTTSDDGSWLWIDGTLVVTNNGLHEATEATGTISLSAGSHVLSYKYFDRTGYAVAGYDMQPPGSDSFTIVPDGIGGGAKHLGRIFLENPNVTIVADDQGGSGVSKIRWSWDGNTWYESTGTVLSTGKLQNGSYTLRYQAYDSAGNVGDLHELSFQVNTALSVQRTYAPVTYR